MRALLISTLSTLIPMLILDGIWLSLMMSRFYRTHLDSLIAATPKLIPAIFFYPLYAFGLAALVIIPAIQHEHSIGKILMMGGIFGLVAYGTYDLTNHATLRDWPLIVTIVDLIWGTILTAALSLLAVTLTKLF